MTTAVQIALLLASVVFIIVAIMAMGLIVRLTALSRHAERVIVETHAQSQKLQEILASIDQVMHSARGVERVVNRATAIGSRALDEVETPLRTVIALFRGVRAGAGSFLRSQFTANGSAEPAGAIKGEPDDVTRGGSNAESHG